jgi:glyoxylase-like metal-dependent hydrolase (beta-lactamase superfamily II)
MRFWREIAVWLPAQRVLVCGDALGTARYFRAGDEPLGVHPLLRLRPPRALARYEPQHILCGHGAGVHGPGTPKALEEALATARRRLPRAWVSAIRPRERR